ncbi:hypothetical protein EVAR_48283_1 [Eumeta japonica]|uniref:Uncharacterized protein n=1 Tax=Eumeta variegata TaxID=151549 RepID=A0A4C1WLE5_EUMVA|nr:hypothetical protein EVAR_48283_1 [Eumeta japonica]
MSESGLSERAKLQTNQFKHKFTSNQKFDTGEQNGEFPHLNITPEELKEVEIIERSQEHQMTAVLAHPDLSESPGPTATPPSHPGEPSPNSTPGSPSPSY